MCFSCIAPGRRHCCFWLEHCLLNTAPQLFPPCMPAGGANVPALNDLLGPFGIALGDAVLEGDTTLEPDRQHFASGTHIQRFPAGGYVHGQFLQDKAVEGNFRLWV